MSTVKIACPQCTGLGLIGTVVETRCPQCLGTGTIQVNDATSLAALNTTAAATGNPIVVTMAPSIPPAAVKVANRGK